jgi:hypothetical protein
MEKIYLLNIIQILRHNCRNGVALTETFPLLRALLNLLKESLGRN